MPKKPVWWSFLEKNSNDDINTMIGETMVTSVDKTIFLGIIIDQNLN